MSVNEKVLVLESQVEVLDNKIQRLEIQKKLIQLKIDNLKKKLPKEEKSENE
jgi:CRISPR/Cas system-associated endonuclease Cas1